jgi:transglutaminase-like putative cysteine protease
MRRFALILCLLIPVFFRITSAWAQTPPATDKNSDTDTTDEPIDAPPDTPTNSPPESPQETTIEAPIVHDDDDGESGYWNVQIFVHPSFNTSATHLQMFLPVSTERQNIIAQTTYAPDYNYTESLSGGNRQGQWVSKTDSTKPNWIIYNVTALTKLALRPEQILDSKKAPENFTPPQPLDAETDALIAERLQQLSIEGKPVREKLRVIFDYVVSAITLDTTRKNAPLKEILTERKASMSGKAMLLSAFLNKLNIPARKVTGLMLEDHSIKKGLVAWTQAWLGDEWLNFDPTHGLFGSLPQNYLALFYGDNRLLSISDGVKYDYQFVIRKTSEEAAFDTDALTIPQDNLLDENYFKKAAETEKDNDDGKKAFGRITFITDRIIDDAISDKIIKAAAENSVKVSFYSAPYESQFFRGNYIAKIIAQKLEILKKSDAVFIISEDDAGLYALFQIAQNRKAFRNTSIFLSGEFTAPVAKIFGQGLYRLVKPKEFFIIPHKVAVERAWDIIKDSVIDGLPVDTVAKRWNVPVRDLSRQKAHALSRWRQFVIDTLVLASKSEVNLQSIYLVLILPIIALIIVIFRNIIGIETFGTFSPVIVAVAFLTTGAMWGSILFGLIIVVGIFFRYLFAKIHLHIVARMALLIAVVCMTMLATMILSVYLGWGALINISILPMVIMAGIVENFTQTQMEVGFAEAFRLTISTLLIAVISYLVIDSVGLHTLILIYPEWILAVLAAEIIIGLWSGVRLMEYVRFYKIIPPKPNKLESRKGHKKPNPDAP